MTFEDIIAQQGVLVYKNKGISMLPLLRQNRDIIIVRRKPVGRLKRLDVPVFKRSNGEYVIHRVLDVRENDYVMCGDNQYIREYGITDAQIIGVLDSFVRNGRTIPVRSTPEHPVVPLWYRVYSHLWCDLFYIRAAAVYVEYKLIGIKRRLTRR